MSSHLIIAVGIICKKDSLLALKAPDCINVWPVSENDVIVGTYYRKEPSDEMIDITELNISHIFTIFSDYQRVYTKLIQDSDFNNTEEHMKWIYEFTSGNVKIAIVST